MPIMIQVLLAAVMTTSGIFLTFPVQAATWAENDANQPRVSVADMPSLMPVVVAQVNLGPMPLYACDIAATAGWQRMFPGVLCSPAVVSGSLAWGGVNEAAELMNAPMEERKQDKSKATASKDERNEPNVELLTAAPAPEPVLGAIAAVAMVVGGIWTRARRRG